MLDRQRKSFHGIRTGKHITTAATTTTTSTNQTKQPTFTNEASTASTTSHSIPNNSTKKNDNKSTRRNNNNNDKNNNKNKNNNNKSNVINVMNLDEPRDSLPTVATRSSGSLQSRNHVVAPTLTRKSIFRSAKTFIPTSTTTSTTKGEVVAVAAGKTNSDNKADNHIDKNDKDNNNEDNDNYSKSNKNTRDNVKDESDLCKGIGDTNNIKNSSSSCSNNCHTSNNKKKKKSTVTQCCDPGKSYSSLTDKQQQNQKSQHSQMPKHPIEQRTIIKAQSTSFASFLLNSKLLQRQSYHQPSQENRFPTQALHMSWNVESDDTINKSMPCSASHTDSDGVGNHNNKTNVDFDHRDYGDDNTHSPAVGPQKSLHHQNFREELQNKLQQQLRKKNPKNLQHSKQSTQKSNVEHIVNISGQQLSKTACDKSSDQREPTNDTDQTPFSLHESLPTLPSQLSTTCTVSPAVEVSSEMVTTDPETQIVQAKTPSLNPPSRSSNDVLTIPPAEPRSFHKNSSLVDLDDDHNGTDTTESDIYIHENSSPDVSSRDKFGSKNSRSTLLQPTGLLPHDLQKQQQTKSEPKPSETEDIELGSLWNERNHHQKEQQRRRSSNGRSFSSMPQQLKLNSPENYVSDDDDDDDDDNYNVIKNQNFMDRNTKRAERRRSSFNKSDNLNNDINNGYDINTAFTITCKNGMPETSKSTSAQSPASSSRLAELRSTRRNIEQKVRRRRKSCGTASTACMSSSSSYSSMSIHSNENSSKYKNKNSTTTTTTTPSQPRRNSNSSPILETPASSPPIVDHDMKDVPNYHQQQRQQIKRIELPVSSMDDDDDDAENDCRSNDLDALHVVPSSYSLSSKSSTLTTTKDFKHQHQGEENHNQVIDKTIGVNQGNGSFSSPVAAFASPDTSSHSSNRLEELRLKTKLQREHAEQLKKRHTCTLPVDALSTREGRSDGKYTSHDGSISTVQDDWTPKLFDEEDDEDNDHDGDDSNYYNDGTSNDDDSTARAQHQQVAQALDHSLPPQSPPKRSPSHKSRSTLSATYRKKLQQQQKQHVAIITELQSKLTAMERELESTRKDLRQHEQLTIRSGMNVPNKNNINYDKDNGIDAASNGKIKIKEDTSPSDAVVDVDDTSDHSCAKQPAGELSSSTALRHSLSNVKTKSPTTPTLVTVTPSSKTQKQHQHHLSAQDTHSHTDSTSSITTATASSTSATGISASSTNQMNSSSSVSPECNVAVLESELRDTRAKLMEAQRIIDTLQKQDNESEKLISSNSINSYDSKSKMRRTLDDSKPTIVNTGLERSPTGTQGNNISSDTVLAAERVGLLELQLSEANAIIEQLRKSLSNGMTENIPQDSDNNNVGDDDDDDDDENSVFKGESKKQSSHVSKVTGVTTDELDDLDITVINSVVSAALVKGPNDYDDDVRTAGKINIEESLMEYKTQCKVMEYQMRMLEQSCDVTDLWLIPTKIAQLKQSLTTARTEQRLMEGEVLNLTESNDFLLNELERMQNQHFHEKQITTQNHQNHSQGTSSETPLAEITLSYQTKCQKLEEQIKEIEASCEVRDISLVPGFLEQLKENLASARKAHKGVLEDLDVVKESNEFLMSELKSTHDHIKKLSTLPTRIEELEQKLVAAQKESVEYKEIRQNEAELKNRIEELTLSLYDRDLKLVEHNDQIRSIISLCNVNDISSIPAYITNLQSQFSKGLVLHDSLQKEVEALNVRNKSLAVGIEMTVQMHDEIQSKLDAKTKEYDETVVKLNAAEQAIKLVEEQCNHEITIKDLPQYVFRLEHNLRLADEKVESLQRQVGIAQLDSVEKSVRDDVIQSELATSKSKLDDALRTISKLKQCCSVRNVDEIPNKFNSLEMKVLDLSNKLQSKISLIQDLETAVKTSEQRCEKINQSLVTLMTKQVELKLLLDSSDDNIMTGYSDASADNYENLLRHVESIMEERTHLKEKVLHIVDRCHVTELEEIPSKLKEMEHQRDDLRILLSQAEERISSLQVAGESLKLELTNSMHALRLSGSRRQLMASQDVLSQSLRHIDVSSQVDGLSRKLSDVQEKHTAAEKQVTELTGQLLTLEETKTSLEEQLTNLKQNLDSAQSAQQNMDPICEHLLENYSIQTLTDLTDFLSKITSSNDEVEKNKFNEYKHDNSTASNLPDVLSEVNVQKNWECEIQGTVSNISTDEDDESESKICPTKKLKELETVVNYVIEVCDVDDILDIPAMIQEIRDQLSEARADLKYSQEDLLRMESVASRMDPESRDMILGLHRISGDQVHSNRRASRDPDGFKRTHSDIKLVCQPKLSKLEQAEIEVARLSKALIDACDRTEDVERQIINLQITCNVRDIKEIPIRLAMLEEDIAMMDEMYESLQRSEEQVFDLQQRLHETQEALRGCEGTIEELTISLNSTQNSFITTSDELAFRLGELNEANRAVASLKAELAELHPKSLALEGVVQDLTEKLKEAIAQRDHATEPGRDMEHMLDRKEREIEALQKELEENSNELTKARVVIDDLEHDRNYYSSKLSELQSIIALRHDDEKYQQLMNKSLECAQLHAEKDSLQRKLCVAETRAKTLQQENEKKTSLIHEMGSRYGSDMTTEKFIERLQNENDRTLRRATDTSIKLAECQMRIDELTETLKRVQRRSIESNKIEGRQSRHSRNSQHSHRSDIDIDLVSFASTGTSSFEGTPVKNLVRSSFKHLKANVQKHMSSQDITVQPINQSSRNNNSMSLLGLESESEGMMRSLSSRISLFENDKKQYKKPPLSVYQYSIGSSK